MAEAEPIVNDLAPSMGHNLSFMRIEGDALVLDPGEMRAYLAEEIETLTARKNELLGSVNRVPDRVSDDVTAGRVADLIKLIAACVKNGEADRVSRKEPFLEGGRVVDAVFRGVTDPLNIGKTEIERKLTLYQREVAETERRRREAIAQAEREEADRKRRQAEEAARQMQTDEDLAHATSAEAEARQREADAIAAARDADVKPAELSRQRSDMGAVASLRQFWDWADLDRDRIDLETLRSHLPLDAIEKAVRSFIKAGGRELKGVRIFPNTATSVR